MNASASLNCLLGNAASAGHATQRLCTGEWQQSSTPASSMCWSAWVWFSLSGDNQNHDIWYIRNTVERTCLSRELLTCSWMSFNTASIHLKYNLKYGILLCKTLENVSYHCKLGKHENQAHICANLVVGRIQLLLNDVCLLKCLNNTCAKASLLP